uniref:F-box domain-containing protein n=1 Tax=Strongyloides venezuelensis TaxID=75913 RepID=A0A0K0G0G0_STRVS
MTEILPVEIWKKVFGYLNKPTKYSASLCCATWRKLLVNEIPRPYSIHVVLDSSCSAIVKFRDEYSTCISICQCETHCNEHNDMLYLILDDVKDRLSCLMIEDMLLNRNNDSYLSQKTLSIILSKCGYNLRDLHFEEIDFNNIKAWCLAFMSIFHLERIVFKDCKFPEDNILNESFLLRSLAKSFEFLTHIEFTNSDFITDKFGMTIAKSCTKLEYFNLNGCPNMSSLTIVAFCENLQYHSKTFVHLSMIKTNINCDDLQRLLFSPLLRCGPNWRCCQVNISLGYQQPALVLENVKEPHLLMVILT